MLEMIRGCYVPEDDKLKEEYKVDEFYITANVNASKIEEIFQHFIIMQNERMFFILELPSSAETERRLNKNGVFHRHKDIYYIDGLFNEQALFLLMNYGELLIHDGICNFGFGVHDGSAEIMLNKYNQMTVWTNDMKKYSDFFDKHDIHITDNYISAWDTFTDTTPGDCIRISVNGTDVFDLPEKLEESGMYFAETREE